MKIFRPESFFVFAALIFAFAESVSGCSYIGDPFLPQSFIVAKTKTIFLGEVTAKTNYYKKTENGKYWVQRVKFKIEKAFKGVSGETIEVIFSEKVKKTSCDNGAPQPRIGEKWVIYDGDIDYSIWRYLRHESTSISFKYSPEEDAKYIEELEKLTSKPVTTIQGQIHSADSSALKNIEVILEGNGIRQTTKTGDWGKYTFENIPAGKYKVRLLLPYNTVDLFSIPKQPASFDNQTQKYFFEYEVTVSAGDSEYKYFLLDKIEAPKETSN